MRGEEWIDDFEDESESGGFALSRVAVVVLGVLSALVGSFVLGRCSVGSETGSVPVTTEPTTIPTARTTSTGNSVSTTLFVLSTTSSSAIPAATMPPIEVHSVPPGTAARMLERVNEERGREGLSPLTWCPALARAAENHSADMSARQYFEHDSPDGLEVWDRVRSESYDYESVGENIAVGQRSVTEVMDGWMDSPGHRENIMNPEFEHFGLGTVTGRYEGIRAIYWTQNFGSGGNCD